MSKSVELSGDWARLKQVLNEASPKLKSESRRTIGRQLKKIEATVLGHIDKQDLGWAELNKSYAKAKMKKHNMMDDNILYASGQMYHNINVVQEDNFSGMVGVKRGVKTKDGADITDIALIHEQPDDDGKKIPARKLWKPTFEAMKAGILAELKGIAIEVFKK